MYLRYRERRAGLEVSLVGRRGQQRNAVLASLGTVPPDASLAWWSAALARLDHLRETGVLSAAERARVVCDLAKRVPVPDVAGPAAQLAA